MASASPRIARRAISAWVAAISLVGISPAFLDLTALDERAPVPGMHGEAPSLQPRGDLTSPLGPPSPSEGVALTPAPSSSPPSRLYDASTFGARGDGQTNDTAAIQAAIAAAAAAGGGVVFLPSGTYPISQATLAAGVTIQGSGPSETTIQAIGRAGLPTITARGVAGIVISSLTVEGRGVAGGTGDEILINLIDVPNARVSDVHIDRAQGIGLQVEGARSSDGVYEDIRITNTFIRGNGFHGVGFWFFAGPHHNQVSNLTTDTSDGPGLMLDAGTTVGEGVAVVDNVLVNVTVLRAARQPGGAGIVFAGASRNTLIGFRIEDTFAHNSVALSIQQDQTGVPAERNVIAEGVIVDVGGSAFDLESSSENVIRDVSVRSIGRVEPARLIQLTSTSVNNGQAALPTIGNTFRRLTLTQSAGSYLYGVRLDSSRIPILRNRFEEIGWGTPTRGMTERIGPNAPLTGIDANILLISSP